MISKEVWNNVIVPGGEDAEFDWFGIDKNGQVGAFSTFNRGYIPEIVKSSHLKYLELLNEIENLPLKYNALLLTKEQGSYDDWLEYSQQGFIAFDYGDVNRTINTGIFDLISKPENLVTASELGIKISLIERMPKFNLSFYHEIGITEQKLRNKII